MKILNKKNLSFLLLCIISFSIVTSQTNFVHAEKQKSTTSKALSLDNTQFAALKKKEKNLIQKIKFAKKKAVKEKLKKELELIQKQIQALSKSNKSTTTTISTAPIITPDSVKPLPTPHPTPNLPTVDLQPNSHPLETISKNDVQITTSNGPSIKVEVTPLEPNSLPPPVSSTGENSKVYILADIKPASEIPQGDGSYTITISLSDDVINNGSDLKLLHYENDKWVDITTNVDLVNKTITGKCSHFSGFAVTGRTGLGTCPSNYWINPEWNLASTQGPTPSPCPENSITDPGSAPGLCCRCPTGFIRGYNLTGSCPPGSSPYGSGYYCCYQCPNGSMPNPNKPGTGSCPTNSFPSDSNNYCCFTCSPGSTVNPNRPSNCPYGSVATDATKNCCISCPEGSVSNPNRPGICMIGTGISTDVSNNCCVSCPLGSFDNPDPIMLCPDGTTSTNNANNNCCQCPAGTYVNYNPAMTCSSADPSHPFSYSLTNNYCCFNCPAPSMQNPDRPNDCMVGFATDATKKCCSTSCPNNTVVNLDPTMNCPAPTPHPYFMDNNYCCFGCPEPADVIMANPDPAMACPADNPIAYGVGNNCCFQCPVGSSPNLGLPFMACPAGTACGPGIQSNDCCIDECPENYEVNIRRPICPEESVCAEGNLCHFSCLFNAPAGFTPNPNILQPNNPGPGQVYPNCPFNQVPNDPSNICCYTCGAGSFPNPSGMGGACPAPFRGFLADNTCCSCPFSYVLNPNRTEENPNALCPPNHVPSDPSNTCCHDCTLGGALPNYFPNPTGAGACPNPLVGLGANNLCCSCPLNYAINLAAPDDCLNDQVPSDPSNSCCFQCPAGFTRKPAEGCPANSVSDLSGKCCSPVCPENYTPSINQPVNSIPHPTINNCFFLCPNGSVTNANGAGMNCPAGFTEIDETKKCCFNTDCSSYLVNNTDAAQCMAKTSPPPDNMIYQLTCAAAGAFCIVSGPVNNLSNCTCMQAICGNDIKEGNEYCDGMDRGLCTGDNQVCNDMCNGCTCANGYESCAGMCCPTNQCISGQCCLDPNMNCVTSQGPKCCAPDNCLSLFNPDNTGATVCCEAPQTMCGIGGNAKCCETGTMCVNATGNCCLNTKICGPVNNPICCMDTEVCDIPTMTCVTQCEARNIIERCRDPGGCPDGGTCMEDLTVGALRTCGCGPEMVGCGNGIVDDSLLARTIKNPSRKYSLEKRNKKEKFLKAELSIGSITTTFSEQCDDGNTISGDGCNCGCQTEYCGDNWCNWNNGTPENCSNCPNDCGPCPVTCGNGICSNGETCSSCPGDCGSCSTPGCGNGVVDPGEDCEPPGTAGCNSDCTKKYCSQ